MNAHYVRTGAAAVLTLALALTACGGAQHASAPTIEDLRRRAATMPDDASAQRDLAEAELLLVGGDASRAEAQIARALTLDESSLELRYLAAAEREIHGHPEAALSGFLDVLERASRSDDPRAPAFALVAAAEVHGLDDSVAGYAERVQAALSPLHADADNALGPAARAQIADLLIDIAHRRGQLDDVAAIAAAQRCATEWRVIGPFGPHHLLGYDGELPPDADDALGAEYDLGPSRGVRPTRDVHARGCNVHVGGGPVGGGGTTFAEASIEVPEAGEWLVRAESPNAVHLSIDGERVASANPAEAPRARTLHVALPLSAGTHRVRARISSRHPNPVLNVSLHRGASAELPELGETLTDAYLGVQRAIVTGDPVAARERVREHLVEDGSSAFLIAGTTATLNDPLRDSTVRHDTARRLLSWARARDAQALYPVLTLAQLEANEGRDLAAIESLTEAMEAWPEAIGVPLQLLDWLEARGWQARANAIVDHALEVAPDACRPRRAALHRAQRRHRASEIEERAEALVACDARSDARLRLRLSRRQWDPAIEELARLAALEPEERSIGELQARLEVARAQGAEDAFEAALAELRARLPVADRLVLTDADRVAAGGDLSAARQVMSEALAREPEAMAGLRRVLWAMGGESPLESYRRDGREVISAFESSGRTYEEPMVLVFDYTVHRVFEDGSMLELTHNIFRLQSQEAVDSMGEFAVPDGAHMLTMQTVKEDGRRLEPDEIAGKETISFASLAPGDYIEFEYMRPRPAPAGFPSAFVGERFYFRNYVTPFDVSQLTVVTPRSVELAIDPRGDAPETQMSVEGDTRVYRWSVQESRPYEQEPASVPGVEFFPSIYWGHDATWEMYVESLRDVLFDRDARDPAAVRLAMRVGGEGPPEMRAARLHRWVLENLEDSQDVFGSAPAMLASRTGNRTRVFRYLLEMAGIEAHLALSRSFASDMSEPGIPNDDTYQSLLVRLRGTDGWRWTHAGARGSPFGYLPPTVEGMEALLLTPGAERVTVPERGLEERRRTVEVDVELRSDGSARLRVAETFRGAGAVFWRNQLEGIPDARLDQQFESAYVANLLPGAELTRLVITGREDPDANLVLRYDVSMDQLARRTRGVWVVPSIFRTQLAPQFARVPSRQIPQLVDAGLAIDVEVRLRVPPGAEVTEPPEARTLESVHGSRVEIGSSRADDSVVLTRSFRLPRMRISPSEYEEFARFCQAADEAESTELRVRMP